MFLSLENSRRLLSMPLMVPQSSCGTVRCNHPLSDGETKSHDVLRPAIRRRCDSIHATVQLAKNLAGNAMPQPAVRGSEVDGLAARKDSVLLPG
jgi:hypothetical protein